MGELLKTDMPNLNRVYSGKVRDIYEVEGNYLMVTTDRLSAFDVVMSRGIPDRGKMLTEISLFWFDYFKDTIGNHLITANVDEMPTAVHRYRDQVEGRSMYVRKAEMLLVECVARGYIVGSGWKDYQKTGTVCGHKLPEGMQLAQKLDKPLFTPATKAEQGEHDENIDFERASQIVGVEMATKLRDLTLDVFSRAGDYAREKGIIIADTKFEFGQDDAGKLYLIDEALTPDSSRFWPADQYAPGTNPPSFDKQYVRDWLESINWNKKPPAPELPAEVAARTGEKYREALSRLTS